VPDPIAALKKDHKEAAALLRQLSSAKPGARRRALAKKLTEELTLHMQIEEREIYPLVAKRLKKEQSDEAKVEHRLARDGISKLGKMVDAPGFGAVVEMLQAGIRHHVKEEETELFPKLKKKLDADELRALGEKVASAKKARKRR
jgi:hemerythrin-like domain-containing protein